MCLPTVKGNRCVMDCITCGLGVFSPACISSQFKTMALHAQADDVKTIRYEDEVIIEFDEEKTDVVMDYIGMTREVDGIIIKPETYGRKEDEEYSTRKKVMQKVYDSLFMNPLIAAQAMESYNEATPSKAVFMEGYKKFQTVLRNLKDRLLKTKLYELTYKFKDPREALISMAGLKSLHFIKYFLPTLPKDAKPLSSPEANYSLPYGIDVKVYDLEKSEAYLYVQENMTVENLPADLQKMMSDLIIRELDKGIDLGADPITLHEGKVREYRQYFIDFAITNKIQITDEQALAMAREGANWVVGLGSPIENISLDKGNVTDVYIDSENSPLYIEHIKFGLCHTLFRYNREMLEHSTKNILFYSAEKRRFDKENPVTDVMLPRLNMRCHLQGPPATFGELQAALRIMKDKPFTYAEYLYYWSMTPFFAGYDDVMVSLGCSEAVLGLKGVGKTAFTAAKIIAIGNKRRILPIEDIEEIPTRTYRKFGFHIGAMRVQPSEKEEMSQTELSLVAMANASLRMGDACLIINEIRSRLAIQGIINLLNTQPGVFCLYNLHAQSLRDVQDRLELVFGIPAASMFATDRYSFLKKVRFGRKGRVYRVLGNSFESEPEQRRFVEVFKFARAENIEESRLDCNFLTNKEAKQWSLSGVSVAKLEKELGINFIPPALQKRCTETGITPEQYILQAFFKGKMYSDIHQASKDNGIYELLEIDFVIKCSSAVNKLLKEKEKENGSVDYKDVEPLWEKKFKELLKDELKSREIDKARSSKPKAA
ncbi:Flp pilus assembly complex ATPase component TadA [Candidatus Micrarchaeota archaeon]|nr:Flp pilus assembly complex ATPase component TadA [Candidatus Micrarchaeota archaeon]